MKIFIILWHFLDFIANHYAGFPSAFAAPTSPRLIMLSRSCQKGTAGIMVLVRGGSDQFCAGSLGQPLPPTHPAHGKINSCVTQWLLWHHG